MNASSGLNGSGSGAQRHTVVFTPFRQFMAIQSFPVHLGLRQFLEILTLIFLPFGIPLDLHFPVRIKQGPKELHPPPGMLQVPFVAFEAMQHDGCSSKYGRNAMEVLRAAV
jgi:hypothetical protein